MIKDIALPFWAEIVQLGKASDFVFSKNLVPGENPITAIQISRRWQKHVKLKLGVTADFYSLKHSNADDIAALRGIGFASDFVGHTNVKTTKIYAVGEDARRAEAFRKLDNEL